MSELYSKLRYGYNLSDEAAKDLASSYEGIIWNTKAEIFFNELLGWDYSAVDYYSKLSQADHKQKVEEIKATNRKVEKEVVNDKFYLLVFAICLLMSGFIGLHVIDALATNWVRVTRDCTDTCHLDIR